MEYGCLVFRLPAWMCFCACFVSVVLGGSTGQRWGGRPLLRFVVVFSGGFPAWATSVM